MKFGVHWSLTIIFFHFQIGSMSYDELDKRVAALEKQMELEIEELIKRYQAKRQPILDAIDAKKKRQQNF